MRTVFLGTSDFAVAILERLAASPHRPALVVTRPARPRGRGRRLAAPPVADAARGLAIEVDQPESVNDDAARARIAAVRPDAVCVCAFGALIKEPLLSEQLMLNVHPSLLPRWRGAAPVERAIIAGDTETGVSIMRITAGLDSGPICLQASERIAPDDTYGTLAPRLAQLGGDLLVRALDESPPWTEQDDALDESPQRTEQDDALATYADKITAQDRLLDPLRPAVELERVVRALTPHIGAHVKLEDGTLLGVREARALPAADSPPAADSLAAAGPAPGAPPANAPPPGAAPAPGTISLDGRNPVLGCAEGALELVVVQPSGRRPMSGDEFLRGHRGAGA